MERAARHGKRVRKESRCLSSPINPCWHRFEPERSGVPGDVEGGDGRGQVASVDVGVVVGTQQGQVQQSGLATIDPMPYMMGIGLPPV